MAASPKRKLMGAAIPRKPMAPRPPASGGVGMASAATQKILGQFEPVGEQRRSSDGINTVQTVIGPDGQQREVSTLIGRVPPEQSQMLRDKMFRRPPAPPSDLNEIAQRHTNNMRNKFFGGRGVQQQPGLDMVSLGVPSRELMQGEGNEWQPLQQEGIRRQSPGTMNFNKMNPDDMRAVLEQFYSGRNVRGM